VVGRLKDKQAELLGQWERETGAIEGVRRIKADIEQTKLDIEEAERALDYNRAAELRYGKLNALEKQLAESAPADGLDGDGKPRLLKEEVGPDDIAGIIARWTGIPVTRLLEGEREKLLRLPEQLHERVIGQEEAVQAVSDAVLRARAGLKDPQRPGSSCSPAPRALRQNRAVQKQASAVDTGDNMVAPGRERIHGSIRGSHRLAPGYVGYDEGSQLTEPCVASRTAWSVRRVKPTRMCSTRCCKSG
jgi:ATP-dependent Clp protease ATP-binding subunit ClpB